MTGLRFIAALALACVTLNASPGGESRQSHRATGLHRECNVTMPCAVPSESTADQVRVTRGRYVARQVGFGVPIERRDVRARRANLQGKRAGSNVVSYGIPSPSFGYSLGRPARYIA